MGFFGKKKEVEIEENNESILKEELETEVEGLQNEFRVKQEEITKITEKIQTVKEEYDTTVTNLNANKKRVQPKKDGIGHSSKRTQRNKRKDQKRSTN